MFTNSFTGNVSYIALDICRYRYKVEQSLLLLFFVLSFISVDLLIHSYIKAFQANVGVVCDIRQLTGTALHKMLSVLFCGYSFVCFRLLKVLL